MKWLAIVLGVIAFATDARAEDVAAAPYCELASSLIVSQDQGSLTINCSNVTVAFGEQLSGLMTQILKRRLDPQAVLTKLDDIEQIPEDGKARTVDETQRQAIIQSLVNKPAQEIAIVAHSTVADSADYGRDIATPLMMVGWQIQGHQIKRTAPKMLDEVRGVALLVRDRNQPPQKAGLLKAALGSARIVAPLLSDPSVPADAVTLWIGKRPMFMEAAQ